MELVDAKIREPTGAHDGTGLMMQHKRLQAVKMSQSILDGLRHPIVQAPMAGGVSTPALAAAVSRAGGLGFLAAGYKTVDEVERDLAAVRSLLPAGVPYGLNLFAPPGHGAGVAEINSYADRLREEAQERGVALGNPRGGRGPPG